MVPSDWSCGPRNDGSVEKLTPLVVGELGVPVPSTQVSFCIQLTAIGPAALGLKIALFGLEAASRSVAESSVHPPGPKAASKAVRAAARSNRIRVWNSPFVCDGSDTASTPAP